MGEGNRSGILNNLDLFTGDTIFIFHDIYRQPERNLSIRVANQLNRKISFFENGDYWAVIE
jgi:hypothetical protein